MTERIFHWLGEPIAVCDCDCHRQDMRVMHCFPCCGICYKRYITPEGKADIDLLNKALEQTYEWRKENGYLRNPLESDC